MKIVLNEILKYVLSAILLVSVIIWQSSFYNKTSIYQDFGRKGSTGLMYKAGSAFVYFYYYLDLYPLWSNKTPVEYSKDGALNIINNYPETLSLEHSSYILWGEHGKTLLMLFDAYVKGTPENPSVKTFNSLFFIFSLVALLASFIYINKPFLGFISVLLLGSDPFQLYEVYANENVFGFNKSILAFHLALHLPLMVEGKFSKPWIFISSFVSGIIFGAVSHIRMESAAIMLSCFMVYAFLPKTKWYFKLAPIILLLGMFISTSKVFASYFDQKISDTVNYVQSISDDGLEIPQFRDNYHTFWHPLLIGLSDFDDKYGNKWDDNYAYSISEHLLMQINPDKFKKLTNREVWSVQPEYKIATRRLVLYQIYRDPMWYAEIISRRFIRVLNKVTPLQIAYADKFVRFQMTGWLLLPVLAFLIYKRDWFRAKVVLFSLPVSAVIIIIYSAKNTTNISCYHIFTASIVLDLLMNFTQKKYLLIISKLKNYVS